MVLRREQQADKARTLHNQPVAATAVLETVAPGALGDTGGNREPLLHLRHPALKKLTGSVKILERSQSTERSAVSSSIYKRRAEDTAA